MTWPYPVGRTLRAASLHTKLMLALAALVALVIAGSAYFEIERERDRRLLELEARATQFADLLSRSLAQPLWNVDRRMIESQLAALADNPEVAELSVTAGNYGPVSTVTRGQPPGAPDAVVRVRPIEYAAPTAFPAQQIGDVRVVLSRVVTERAIAAARRQYMLIAAAIIATLYAATYVLLKRLVRGPVNRLEAMVDRIASGDLQARCRVESGDELGRLAARVNAMADRLRASTAWLDEAQRIAHVGYWDRNLDTGRITLSDEVCSIFGLQPEACVVDLTQWHERWLAIIHPEDRPRIAEAAAAALRGGPPYDVEYRVVRPSGEVRIIYSRGEVTRDASGRPRRMFGMMQDITELRASEARFRTFVDHATDGFFLHDDHLTVLDVNRQACESLGYSREELIGMHPRDFDVGLDEAAIERLAQRVDAGETVTLDQSRAGV